MRFRKLILCMLIMVLATGFSNIKAYAAENATLEQDLASYTEEASAESNEVTEVTEVTDGTEMTGASELTDENEITVSNEETNDNEIAEKEEVIEDNDESEVKEDAEDDKSNEDEATSKEKVVAKKYTNADLRLLSALIYCEAQGESYNGKIAVGIVVMNRKRSNRYPDTVKNVIYQRYQFSPVRSGSLSTALNAYDNGNFTSSSEKECIKAAKAALSGTTVITVKGKEVDFSKYLSFSGRLSGYTYRIGNHQFK